MQQVAIIGLGRFGFKLAANLTVGGAEVIAIDSKEQLVHDIADVVHEAVCMDCTDEAELIKKNVAEVDTIVIAIGEDILTSILVTTILRRLGATNIIARATNSTQAEILSEVGARQTLFIEEAMAELTAELILSGTTLERHETIKNYSFAWITPPEPMQGNPINIYNFKHQYGLTIVGIRRKIREIGAQGETIIRHEMDDRIDDAYIIHEDDTLLLHGANNLLDNFSEDFQMDG